MGNQNAKIDQNKRATLLGITDDENEEIRPLLVDPTTGRLLVSATISMGDLEELSDVTITSIADNELLQYDSASEMWINQTLAEAGLQAAGDVLDDLNILGTATADNQLLVSTGAGVLAWESGATARASLDVDPAGTDNSTDVTLNAVVTDILSLTTQEISAVDNGSDAVVGWDDTAGKLTYLSAADVRTAIDVDVAGTDNSTDVTIGTANGLSIVGQELSLGLADTDNNGALNSTDWDTFNGKQDALSFGIANTNSVVIDDLDAAATDYCKLTASGIEGRSVSEVRSDLNVADGADVTGSNAPQAHKASHAVGGSDSIFPADPGADKVLQWDNSESALAWVDAGSVDSVNTKTGAVVLDPDDLDDTSTTNKFVTATDVTNLGNLSGSNSGDETATSIGALIGGADDATPNNTDFVATSLTAGGILKKITWTNVKAFLKTYFDTLYGSLTSQETGWNSAGETWTYASVDDPTGVITVPSDATTKYSVGMRISFVNGGNTIYGIIQSVNSTTITFTHEIDPTDSQALHLMADSAITVPKFSTQKAPFGFPLDPRKWTVQVTSTSNDNQASPSLNTVYNLGSLSISLPIGIWDTSYSALFQIGNTTSVESQGTVSLSSANNSISDADLNSGILVIGTGAGVWVSKSKVITASSKTTYYLVAKYVYSAGTVNNLNFRGGVGKTIIRAVCAYL